ncbi:alpha/beta fold hydrolase [Psychrobacillus vulpis]|uniref:Alpha/beta hydrolase n=1 Tax=Psychrobacillus vulpis TaxID=2325572 RepID=A0A544TUC2_9BACI|nr:alpha/beta hydrolase [Psychrobacillus vulpis]TQR21020.1 alpha/beta hydrolase [Psychrobacillus vulpis]
MKSILEVELSDNHLIHVVKYTPEQAPIGHVHILHGMAEHMARYEEFALFLVDKGYVVSGHDHRGHGQTAGKNGQLGFFAKSNGFERVTEDVREVLGRIRENLADVPLILFGHSMGSFIARRYMQKYSESLSQVVICGTSFNPGVLGDFGSIIGKIASKFQSPETESKILNQLSFGGFNKQIKDTQSSFDWLNTDATEVKKYMDDPMCGFVPSNQFYIDLFYGLKTIHKTDEIARIRKDLPVFIIGGTEDPVGKNGKDLFKVAKGLTNAGMKNVTVQLVENARHEILLEKNKVDTFEVIANWMKNNE